MSKNKGAVYYKGIVKGIFSYPNKNFPQTIAVKLLDSGEMVTAVNSLYFQLKKEQPVILAHNWNTYIISEAPDSEQHPLIERTVPRKKEK